jgi:hypothetical protein
MDGRLWPSMDVTGETWPEAGGVDCRDGGSPVKPIATFSSRTHSNATSALSASRLHM